MACRHCSNYIFIFDLIPGSNGLGKNKSKTRQETFKFDVFSPSFSILSLDSYIILCVLFLLWVFCCFHSLVDWFHFSLLCSQGVFSTIPGSDFQLLMTSICYFFLQFIFPIVILYLSVIVWTLRSPVSIYSAPLSVDLGVINIQQGFKFYLISK